MNSGVTALTRAGWGKLIPIPPVDIDLNVEYSIKLEFQRGLDRSNPPPLEEICASVTVKPWFDESYLPDGAYQLQTEKATWRLQRQAGFWHLSEDSLQNIMQTKVRAIAPKTNRIGEAS